MRIALIAAGLVLLVAGLWVTFGHGSYRQTETEAQLGPLKIQASEDKAIPQWVGIAGIVVGGVLAASGLLRKR